MCSRGWWLALIFLLDAAAFLVGADNGGEGVALLLGRLLGVSLLGFLSVRVALGRWPRLCGSTPEVDREEETPGEEPAADEAHRGTLGVTEERRPTLEAPKEVVADLNDDSPTAVAEARRKSTAESGMLEAGSADSTATALPETRSRLLLEEDGESSARARPLLQETRGQPSASSQPAAVARVDTDGDERARRIDRTMESQRALLMKQQRGNITRNCLLGACYVYVNVCSMRMSILAIRMEALYSAVTLAKIASILLMNAEFILLKGLVLDSTSGVPVQMPGLHNHLLYWSDVDGKGYMVCSCCNTKVGEKTGGFLVLQCRLCVPGRGGYGGFQVCSRCYRKQAIKAKEQGAAASASGAGILRSDRGPRPPTPLSVSGYISRLSAAMRKDIVILVLLSVGAAQVVNAYIPKAQGDCITALIESADDFDLLIERFAYLALASSVLGFAMSTATSVLSTNLRTDTSMRLFKSLLSQDIAFYDNAQVGQLTSRLNNDLGQAISPVQIIVNSFLANVVMLAVGFFICIQSSWQLTVLAFTFLSPMIHISAEFSKWAMLQSATQYTYQADASGAATQAFTNIRTVRCFGAQSLEVKKYVEHMTKMMRVGIKSAWGQGFARLLGGLVQQGASFIILYYGGHLALEHKGFTVGSIITFTYLWNRLSTAFSGLNDNLNQPVKAMSAGQRLFEVLDLVGDIQEEEGHVVARGQAEIEFKDVEFTYQSRPDQKVLQGISFKIQAGQTTAIVGKSGCGKSTLTKLLMRFYDPQVGTILVNGRDLKDIHILKFRGLVGVVSQDTQLFRMTVAENISYGLDELCTQQDVERAAKQANADEFIRKLPEGYQTMCGEGGHDFSGGQRQRLSIARALVRKPVLLLLDEATSALDAENEAVVQEALDTLVQEMQGQCSIVVIAHRLSTIKDASQIVVLQEGKVVEMGSHEELLQIKEGKYAELVQRQLAGVQEDSKADTAKRVEEELRKLLDTIPAEKRPEALRKLMMASMKGKGKG